MYQYNNRILIPANILKLKSGRQILAAKGGQEVVFGKGMRPFPRGEGSREGLCHFIESFRQWRCHGGWEVGTPLRFKALLQLVQIHLIFFIYKGILCMYIVTFLLTSKKNGLDSPLFLAGDATGFRFF